MKWPIRPEAPGEYLYVADLNRPPEVSAEAPRVFALAIERP